MTESPAKHESKPMYPTIRIQLDHLPESKKWEVSEANSDKGKEYEIKMKVKMVGISQSRYQNDVELELREMGINEVNNKK